MQDTGTRHVIITPAFNEDKFIGQTLNSVISQTLKPVQWIIVDDASTDGTAGIVAEFAKKFSWITLVHKPKIRQAHSSGGHVASVFSFGLTKAETFSFDFITKLDADLSLPENYFEQIASHFHANARLGVCGGVCAVYKNGSWEIETVTNPDHVRGALKSYSRNCFSAINGLRALEGWDTLDEMLARFHGFDVEADNSLVVKHFKKTDEKTGSAKSAIKSGRAFYLLGYNFPVALLSSIKRGMKRPVVAGFFLSLYGYLQMTLSGKKKAVSSEEQKFINSYRWQAIFSKRKSQK